MKITVTNVTAAETLFVSAAYKYLAPAKSLEITMSPAEFLEARQLQKLVSDSKVTVSATFEALDFVEVAPSVRVASVALATAGTAGGVFAWTPGFACFVHRVVINTTAPSSGACTLDVGVAANATTLADNLIDGVSVATAAGLFDNLNDAGTNGRAKQKVSASQSVTASVSSGAAAGLVGRAFIYYTKQ